MRESSPIPARAALVIFPLNSVVIREAAPLDLSTSPVSVG